jgi:UPF0716 protein FxsA
MLIALALLILWPVAELLLAIKVAQLIGLLDTILLLIISWPIGVWAMRSQGRAVWRRLRAALAAGKPPAEEVLEGALVLIGGVLMILPGFIGDVIGGLLLLGPSRRLSRRVTARLARARIIQAGRFARPGQSYDVESTATDVEQPRLGR